MHVNGAHRALNLPQISSLNLEPQQLEKHTPAKYKITIFFTENVYI